MKWTVTRGNILDIPADVLVCSANVWLNLSGGVGGEILLRHGDAMQRALHQTLAARGRRFADPGDVVETGPFGLNFRAVLHAVAINALYETSVPLVRDVVTASLEAAAKLGARQVALTALATGYGRMSITDFGLACRPLAGESFPPVEQVIVCVRHPAEREVLAETLGLDL